MKPKCVMIYFYKWVWASTPRLNFLVYPVLTGWSLNLRRKWINCGGDVNETICPAGFIRCLCVLISNLVELFSICTRKHHSALNSRASDVFCCVNATKSLLKIFLATCQDLMPLQLNALCFLLQNVWSFTVLLCRNNYERMHSLVSITPVDRDAKTCPYPLLSKTPQCHLIFCFDFDLHPIVNSGSYHWNAVCTRADDAPIPAWLLTYPSYNKRANCTSCSPPGATSHDFSHTPTSSNQSQTA